MSMIHERWVFTHSEIEAVKPILNCLMQFRMSFSVEYRGSNITVIYNTDLRASASELKSVREFADLVRSRYEGEING